MQLNKLIGDFPNGRGLILRIHPRQHIIDFENCDKLEPKMIQNQYMQRAIMFCTVS